MFEAASVYLYAHQVQPQSQHYTNAEHTHYHTNYQTTNYNIKAL